MATQIHDRQSSNSINEDESTVVFLLFNENRPPVKTKTTKRHTGLESALVSKYQSDDISLGNLLLVSLWDFQQVLA